MFNLHVYIKLCLLIALITTHDIQAASVLERVRSIFNGCFCCGNAATGTIPIKFFEENERCYVSKNNELGRPVSGEEEPFGMDSKTTGINRERSRTRSITELFVKSAIERLEKSISASAFDEIRLTYAELCEQVESEFFDPLSIKKISIVDEINERNRSGFIAELSVFKNLEGLILENCEDLESIFVAELNALQNLRHLELHNFYMSTRCVGGYGNRGVKIENLLAVLNIKSLKILILTGHDLSDENKSALLHNANQKGMTIILKGW